MLGRGLESLIPNKNQQPAVSQPSSPSSHQQNIAPPKSNDSIFHLEIEKIKPNPHQPRKIFDDNALEELAASIREVGIIQPLIVTKIQRETDMGSHVEYQLIAGERRLLAAKKAGLERVPAIVRAISQEKEKLEIAIIENIQRDDLNPIEAARSYAKLQEEFGLTQREVAARVGKSRETIANTLRLLNLPSYIQDAIGRKEISDSQGRLLLVIEDQGQQRKLFEEITHNNLSVRELKLRIGNIKRKEYSAGQPSTMPIKDPDLSFLEEKLQETLGTKVSLQKTSDGSGRITINFFSTEEFQSIIQKLLEQSSVKEPENPETDLKMI